MEKSPRVTEAENPERVSAVSPNPLSSIINVYGYSKFGIAKSMQLSGLMSRETRNNGGPVGPPSEIFTARDLLTTDCLKSLLATSN